MKEMQIYRLPGLGGQELPLTQGNDGSVAHPWQVEIRAFLERARPIDRRLRYQMDKLLQAAAAVQPGSGAAAGRNILPALHTRRSSCERCMSVALKSVDGVMLYQANR